MDTIDFRPVTLQDRQKIEQYTLLYAPQDCEFSFGNLFCWQEIQNTHFAIFQNCLLLRFTIKGKNIYTFPIGKNITTDLFQAIQEQLPDATFQAEESVLKQFCDESAYNITPHRDFFDYIYLRENLANLTGKHYQQKRNHINKFKSCYQYEYKPLDNTLTQKCILLGKELLVLLINFVQKYYGERIKVLISQDLAAAVIDKVLSFKVAFFTCDENKPGKVQTRIDRGVDFITMTVRNFFIDILPLGTSAVFALVLMFVANFYVGLTALLIVPIYFYITYLQAGKLKNWRTNMRNYREAKSNGIMNILQNIQVIKSFNREEIEYKKQTGIIKELTDNQLNTRKYSFLYDGLKTFMEQIGTVLIIILTSYLVLIDYPGMTIGKIMYHVMLFANVTAPIRQLHRIYDDVNEALIYAEGYFDILHSNDSSEQTGDYCPEKVLGEIEIEHVDFTYPNGCKALTDINMKIPHGKITAFVGLSGAGKSTVVNLLDKFYEPDCGVIKVDGVDIRKWNTQYLRENIGLVLQKNHIFDGSIEENIRYGRPDATFDEVCLAAKKAYIYDVVEKLPQGFNTNASELSGGQQQRIAIARMFLKNPPIIFLDEPTASLDAIATEQIKNAIDAIKQNRTVVIISHSISQIIDSEMIYALRDGRVEQSGSPDEIYRQGGIYKEIFDASARSLNIEKIMKTTEKN